MTNIKKSQKIGRNDLCPCGSGVKFKFCICRKRPNPNKYSLKKIDTNTDLKAKAFMDSMIADNERKSAIFKKKYGDSRPIISAIHNGKRFINIGNEILYLDNCKTFHDLLFYYLKSCLGHEWGRAELEKELKNRHIILQWADSLERNLQANSNQGSFIQSAAMTGTASSYLALAYDLYILRHNSLLQKKLIERLKINKQFQGARYEIYLTASFIKAGFIIDFEDEADGSKTHCEFVATHKKTSFKYSVEAKSRHRKGVLGQNGIPEKFEDIPLRIGKLLNDGLKKEANHERIVFIDINMPPPAFSKRNWPADIAKVLSRIEKQGLDGNPSPKAHIFFTNIPNHYVGNEGDAQCPNFFIGGLNLSKFHIDESSMIKKIELDTPINELWQSLNQHWIIPTFFDDINPIMQNITPISRSTL